MTELERAQSFPLDIGSPARLAVGVIAGELRAMGARKCDRCGTRRNTVVSAEDKTDGTNF